MNRDAPSFWLVMALLASIPVLALALWMIGNAVYHAPGGMP
jgi:hypothetical protein